MTRLRRWRRTRRWRERRTWLTTMRVNSEGVKYIEDVELELIDGKKNEKQLVIN